VFCSKGGVPEFERFEINYWDLVFEKRNNFGYRNVFWFEMYFKLKLIFLSKFESNEVGHLGSFCSLV
jgi:hypothetical protein